MMSFHTGFQPVLQGSEYLDEREVNWIALQGVFLSLTISETHRQPARIFLGTEPIFTFGQSHDGEHTGAAQPILKEIGTPSRG